MGASAAAAATGGGDVGSGAAVGWSGAAAASGGGGPVGDTAFARVLSSSFCTSRASRRATSSLNWDSDIVLVGPGGVDASSGSSVGVARDETAGAGAAGPIEAGGFLERT
jgi:hypothetical protein